MDRALGGAPPLAPHLDRDRGEHDPPARRRGAEGDRRLRLGAALLAAALAAGPAAAAALHRVQGGACVLEAPAGYQGQAEELGRRAPLILERLARDLGAPPTAPFTLVLLPPGPFGDPDLARLDASAPEWAAGFIRPAERRGALRVALADRYPYGNLEAVFTHEAAHQLLHDAAGGALPRWFDEGVATREARRWNLEDMLVYSSALLTGGLPSLDEMDAAFAGSAGRARAAYAASSEFVAWTAKRHGDGAIRALIQAARTRPFPAAWAEVTGTSLVLAEREWRQGSLFRYRWIPVLTGTTTLWIGVTALALLAGARRRARTRAIAERWEAEEAGMAAPPRRHTGPYDDAGDDPLDDEKETLH